MKSATYEELSKLLKNLCEERNVLQSQIDENNLHIQETQSLNQKMIESEEEDFHIFSPRKYKSIYKDELEQSNTKKTDYETQNSQLLEKIKKLDSFIQIIKNVVEESKESVEEQIGSSDFKFTDLQDNVYENLEHVLHRVGLSIKFINQDPERAKMELAIVNETLQKVLQQNI